MQSVACTFKSMPKHDMITCFGSSAEKSAWLALPHKVKGEVAVTEGFVPFKVPGSPVVDKTVFPSPLSQQLDEHVVRLKEAYETA